MLTELQKKTAQAVVNIFETGRVLGNYGNVTLLPGDRGRLTYGRSQTTLASGNLHLLIKAYCETPGATHADALTPYLPRLASRDLTLDADLSLHRLLREAGEDPVMHDVQDQFFDRIYWAPSLQSATNLGVQSALGVCVVYDSRLHGSWGVVRDLTTSRHGQMSGIGERTWINHYVAERRAWLASCPPPLPRTVYRMDAFAQLIDTEKWDLQLPLRVRWVLIDEAALLATAPVRASAHSADERTLLLQSPPMRGDDVTAVQQALRDKGVLVEVDGIFGRATEAAVKQFQEKQGLKVDGIVGPATRAALGL